MVHETNPNKNELYPLKRFIIFNQELQGGFMEARMSKLLKNMLSDPEASKELKRALDPNNPNTDNGKPVIQFKGKKYTLNNSQQLEILKTLKTG